MSFGGPVEAVSASYKTGARLDYNDYKNVAALIEFMMGDFYEKQFCDILKVMIFLLTTFFRWTYFLYSIAVRVNCFSYNF